LSTTAKRYALGSSRPRPFVASRTSWTYQWTGTWGSCRWDAAGMDGEVRVDYHGLVAGRPVAYISGSPPSVVVPCNDTIWGNSPVWRFNYKGQAAIEPLFNWFEIDDERGTGTFSLICSSCRPPPASSYEVRALWHRSFNFSPTRPRPGKPVRVNERVVLLERSGIDRFWTPVTSANVRVRCEVRYAYSRRGVKKVFVPGFWRTPR
jgi:hypothetical protein